MHLEKVIVESNKVRFLQNKLRKERERRQQAQANMQVLTKTQKSRERDRQRQLRKWQKQFGRQMQDRNKVNVVVLCSDVQDIPPLQNVFAMSVRRVVSPLCVFTCSQDRTETPANSKAALPQENLFGERLTTILVCRTRALPSLNLSCFFCSVDESRPLGF